MPQFVVCPRCNGTGRYRDLGPCIMCRGRGQLDQQRLKDLEEYWKRRQGGGQYTAEAIEAQLAELRDLRRQLEEEAPDNPF